MAWAATTRPAWLWVGSVNGETESSVVVNGFTRWKDEVMAGSVLDPRERQLLVEFVVRWLPYSGGPDEEIMVNFGIDAITYFSRLQSLLTDSARPVELDPATTAAVLEVCRRRLRNA